MAQSKTEEEIIKEIIPEGIVNVKGGYKGEIKAIKGCMKAHAKQEAIAFAHWLQHAEINGRSTEQLYAEFVEQTS